MFHAAQLRKTAQPRTFTHTLGLVFFLVACDVDHRPSAHMRGSYSCGADGSPVTPQRAATPEGLNSLPGVFLQLADEGGLFQSLYMGNFMKKLCFIRLHPPAPL